MQDNQQNSCFLNYVMISPQLLLTFWEGDIWSWKRKPQRENNLFSPPTDICDFYNNEEDSSWRLNFSDNNLNQLTENSCLVLQWPTHSKTLKISSLQWKKNLFEGYVLSSMTFLGPVEGRLSQRGNIFRQGCFRVVKISRENSTFVKAPKYSRHRTSKHAKQKHTRFAIFANLHQIWSSFSEA